MTRSYRFSPAALTLVVGDAVLLPADRPWPLRPARLEAPDAAVLE
jgi:hypothetical protein